MLGNPALFEGNNVKALACREINILFQACLAVWSLHADHGG